VIESHQRPALPSRSWRWAATPREATPQRYAARGGARERHGHPSRRDRCAGVCEVETARHRPAARLRRPNRRAPPITISLDTSNPEQAGSTDM